LKKRRRYARLLEHELVEESQRRPYPAFCQWDRVPRGALPFDACRLLDSQIHEQQAS